MKIKKIKKLNQEIYSPKKAHLHLEEKVIPRKVKLSYSHKENLRQKAHLSLKKKITPQADRFAIYETLALSIVFLIAFICLAAFLPSIFLLLAA